MAIDKSGDCRIVRESGKALARARDIRGAKVQSTSPGQRVKNTRWSMSLNVRQQRNNTME
ncbi:MAG: hypothetical protein JXR49_22185 [Acidobacteria bacterium]|nr:hypothetical protein [Acidobacteriota bacterium]